MLKDVSPSEKEFKKKANLYFKFCYFDIVSQINAIIVIGNVEFKVCFFAIYVMAGLLWYHC